MPPSPKHCRPTLAACGLQPNDLLMMIRRAPAPAAAAAPAPAAAPAAGAAGADGNPVALQADGSAANPELLMSYLEASGQLAGLPDEVRQAVVAKDVGAFQVGGCWVAGWVLGGCQGSSDPRVARRRRCCWRCSSLAGCLAGWLGGERRAHQQQRSAAGAAAPRLRFRATAPPPHPAARRRRCGAWPRRGARRRRRRSGSAAWPRRTPSIPRSRWVLGAGGLMGG